MTLRDSVYDDDFVTLLFICCNFTFFFYSWVRRHFHKFFKRLFRANFNSKRKVWVLAKTRNPSLLLVWINFSKGKNPDCSKFESILTCQCQLLFYLKTKILPQIENELIFLLYLPSHGNSWWQTSREFEKWVENFVSTWQRCFALGTGRTSVDSWYWSIFFFVKK